ncbi:hypothetical protein [Sphingomonas prati]|uniref:Uncharacterized protein n=1 Tax=Sphingomonas prati TaxID=1843237 RepID=A0A7W9BUM8_9SPHN|nr:hypothetical protein [Sphingomonas prati]MBB5730424.1 hypothetical protein [Sphingomonas prati]GGE93974.1 hypothetical protein GCM10011404_28770 [Sphingomonas prati]
MKSVVKLGGLVVFGVIAGAIGASLSGHFGKISYTLSYADFISILLTCLGVMLTIVTLFVGVLAVLGWASIESKLRDHSFSYIGSELEEGKPLRDMIRRTVREAVYEGVGPIDVYDEPYEDDQAA